MSFNDLFEISKGLIQAKYTCSNPKLEDVQVVNFVRGSAQMFRKTSYAEENVKSFRFLQRKYKKSIMKNFERNKENRGVKSAKKDKIIEVLCAHMKETSRHFRHQLDVNEAQKT